MSMEQKPVGQNVREVPVRGRKTGEASNAHHGYTICTEFHLSIDLQ